MARPTDEKRIQRAYIKRLLQLVKLGEPSIDPSTGRQAVDDAGEPVFKAPSAALLKEARTYLQCRGLIKTTDDDQANADAAEIASVVQQIKQAKRPTTDSTSQDSDDQPLQHEREEPAPTSTSQADPEEQRLSLLRERVANLERQGVAVPQFLRDQLDQTNTDHATTSAA